MSKGEPRRVVILGIGNLLLGDEGVGVHVARRLAGVELPEGVEVIEGGTKPVESLGSVGDIAKLIIVDAVAGQGHPGAVYRLPASVVPDSKAQLSLHEFTLAEALVDWNLQGLDETRIVIIGVGTQEVDWGTNLSPEVEASLPAVLETVIAEAAAERTKRE